MSSRTTHRDLDRVAGMIARELESSFYVEGGGGGWTLYEELNPGAHQIAYARTKGELYERAAAYLAGIQRARQDD